MSRFVMGGYLLPVSKMDCLAAYLIDVHCLILDAFLFTE
jgi:hypothetical protein